MVYAKKAICGHLNEKEVLNYTYWPHPRCPKFCEGPQKPAQEKQYAW